MADGSSITAAARSRCWRKSWTPSPGRAHITIDGGFCRGTDIVKAIALGAERVAIGRLYCFGLAAAGEQGVLRVLELLEAEVTECLGLLGADRFGALDRTHLHPAQPTALPHVLSAFPLLQLREGNY